MNASPQIDRMTRVVHPAARAAFKPLAEIAPDIRYQRTDGSENEVMAFAFQDQDGETHVFVLNEQQIDHLKSQLIGTGIIVAGPEDLPKL